MVKWDTDKMSFEAFFRPCRILSAAGLVLSLFIYPALGNPTGGTVTQGSATINSSGSTLNINQSTANALINWQSFNIGLGETVNFNQPSAQSITFNQINDANPSQLLGNLNANGYIVLENANGFYIGGQAVFNVHGLVMTTAKPTINYLDGGPWSFDAPPPTAKIQNYGQINITGGGTAYLIAADIVNNGSINAPNGKIGLYDGETVLVSASPNGQGLSAQVTLPQGSVDNEGKLTASGGSIVAQAQYVNQNGIVQANTAENVNGTIELLGSSSVVLGPNSAISATGDSTASSASAGGSVTIQAGNTFSDQPGSAIDVSGAAQGGNGGQVEISAPQMNALNTSINGQAQDGYAGGILTIDPANIWLDTANNAPSGYSYVSLSSFSGMSQINVQAGNNIVLNAQWKPGSETTASTLSLSAGDDITLNGSSYINAGPNWTVSLTAGTAFVPTMAQPTPAPGSYGIYLDGPAYIESQNGNINLTAANEVQVGWSGTPSALGAVNPGSGSIITAAGGSINVTTLYGDINTGSGTGGFSYVNTAPYYTVNSINMLGGISTAAGGNVTLAAGTLPGAGGNVISYTPSSSDASIGQDSGTGAFGTQAGNVTITAGGSVYGHYVLANGSGTITANTGNVGTAATDGQFALSLISGGWSVNAPNGNIYLTEVRNPNALYNNTAPARRQTAPSGANVFTYAANDSVSLSAGDGVYLTGFATLANVPRISGAADAVPIVYPPILNISAGAGGVTMEGDVTLYPSVDQNLTIVTADTGPLANTLSPQGTLYNGSFTVNTTGDTYLLMSDSSLTSYHNAPTGAFTPTDNGTVLPSELQTVYIYISGSLIGPNPDGGLSAFDIITSKATTLTVGGNLVNVGFSGQNLSANDTTAINVTGQIINSSALSFVNGVAIPLIPANDVPAGFADSWQYIFALAINPSQLAGLNLPANTPPSQLVGLILEKAGLFSQPNPEAPNTFGFSYDPTTGQLGFTGQMTPTLEQELASGTFSVLHLVNGVPVINPSTGQYETDTVSWAPPSAIQTLFTDSQGAPSLTSPGIGYIVGGPGQFNVTAGSIQLGDCDGILSGGVYDPSGFGRYADLASFTPSGASISVTINDPDEPADPSQPVSPANPLEPSLNMLTSAIAALGGGNVVVNNVNGSMDLGLTSLGSLNGFNNESARSYGIFTSGGGNVNVTAEGDIDIDGSRVATYNGGSIFIESMTGNVNVGSGGGSINGVDVGYVNSAGQASHYAEETYGSGVIANTLVPVLVGGTLAWPPNVATIPGDITIKSPEGNITGGLAGIVQIALNGTSLPGSSVTLTAGTLSGPGVTPYVGNIDFGTSPIIGGDVNLSANGYIKVGDVISRQNSTITAAQSFSGNVLAGGGAKVEAGDGVSGNIAGLGGVNVNGGGPITATLLGQNVSANGKTQDTLGSSATATSATQSAAQQSSQAATQQVASDSGGDEKKKSKKEEVIHVSRVTVILSAAVPK
jgi:filamentous hemagglutinin family protein